jgi:hypothetical protein
MKKSNKITNETGSQNLLVSKFSVNEILTIEELIYVRGGDGDGSGEVIILPPPPPKIN